ncbi:MAG: hypothetical protein H6735_23055 [Alphaproteobacteria bacterium]|nr:hypothetical protein [Alphaproteobacteria bacterium]
MIRTLIRLAALVGKEVLQHAVPVAVGVVLMGCMVVVTWVMALQEDWLTLLDVAHGNARFAMPLLALFLAERLVVQDHQGGTHEFLSALPVSPVLRAAVRAALGLAVLLATQLVVLLITAAVASRREGVPLLLLAQLMLQEGCWIAACHGTTFGVAHLGRYRWLAWWCWTCLLATMDGHGRVFGFRAIADGVDIARMDAPWEGLPVALAWGLAGVLFGFAVSGWRGGALLERWFRPSDPLDRGRLVALGVIATLATELHAASQGPTDSWTMLPRAGEGSAVVRVAASPGSPTFDLGAHVASELDGLGAALEVSWPPAVLLRAPRAPGEPVVRPSEGARPDDVSRVVLIDPSAPEDQLVQGVLAQVLGHRAAGAPDWDPDARWVAEGLARWWAPGDTERLDTLAAKGRGHASELLAAPRATFAALGSDVAGAVAYEGLVALEELGGRDAVLAVARIPLAEPWGPFPVSSWPQVERIRLRTRAGWASASAGVDEAAWVAAWERRLERAHPEPAVWPALSLADEDGEVVARWVGQIPEGAVLEWLVLDPLVEGPRAGDRGELVTPGVGMYEAPLPADPADVVAARWVRVEPALGRLTSPWSTR